MKRRTSALGRAEGILEEVLSSDVGRSQLDIVLAAVTADEELPAFQRLNIARGLAADFGRVAMDFLGPLRDAFSDRDLVLHSYEPGAKLDQHEIEVVDLSRHESIERQILGLSEQADLRLFNENDEFISQLRFYVVTVRGRRGAPVHFFRTYTPKKELTRSKLFGVTLQRGQYDRYREHLFLFDGRFDCFSCDGLLFVLNKGNFEKIFRFYELLVRTAHRTLAVIERWSDDLRQVRRPG